MVPPTALSLLLTGALAGCGLSTAPEERLRLVVTVSEAAFTAGDTVAIQVRAFNDTPSTLTFETGGCPLVFEVLDHRGVKVAPTALFCPSILVGWALEPGDSLHADFPWTGDNWIGARGTGIPLPEPLLAGAYEVVGILQTIDEVERSRPFAVRLVPE